MPYTPDGQFVYNDFRDYQWGGAHYPGPRFPGRPGLPPSLPPRQPVPPVMAGPGPIMSNPDEAGGIFGQLGDAPPPMRAPAIGMRTVPGPLPDLPSAPRPPHYPTVPPPGPLPRRGPIVPGSQQGESRGGGTSNRYGALYAGMPGVSR